MPFLGEVINRHLLVFAVIPIIQEYHRSEEAVKDPEPLS